ncbi:EF-hand calcium-binding domain-containing protein 14-like [Acipenser oxyrinchus oxyrinchus]|uniref:EF-hand calcium-binding domain-containing protein 14-like n=1 Tax=Acipenser oxyrinchus oxyrinchus TaxID=40147 RepID=A0AAD8GK08_ACIOX|nr:EF-hand calcium-binding domain-containing protein 14-like [Acipenser oxyrinchus oxyrinchus]
MATEKEKYALLNGDSDLEDELKINTVLIENEKKRPIKITNYKCQHHLLCLTAFIILLSVVQVLFSVCVVKMYWKIQELQVGQHVLQETGRSSRLEFIEMSAMKKNASEQEDLQLESKLNLCQQKIMHMDSKIEDITQNMESLESGYEKMKNDIELNNRDALYAKEYAQEHKNWTMEKWSKVLWTVDGWTITPVPSASSVVNSMLVFVLFLKDITFNYCSSLLDSLLDSRKHQWRPGGLSHASSQITQLMLDMTHLKNDLQSYKDKQRIEVLESKLKGQSALKSLNVFPTEPHTEVPRKNSTLKMPILMNTTGLQLLLHNAYKNKDALLSYEEEFKDTELE